MSKSGCLFVATAKQISQANTSIDDIIFSHYINILFNISN